LAERRIPSQAASPAEVGKNCRATCRQEVPQTPWEGGFDALEGARKAE